MRSTLCFYLSFEVDSYTYTRDQSLTFNVHFEGSKMWISNFQNKTHFFTSNVQGLYLISLKSGRRK